MTIEFVAAALMNVKLIADNVGSYYIQEFTREKRFAITGPKFGKLEELEIIIVKELYGLKSSGAM